MSRCLVFFIAILALAQSTIGVRMSFSNEPGFRLSDAMFARKAAQPTTPDSTTDVGSHIRIRARCSIDKNSTLLAYMVSTVGVLKLDEIICCSPNMNMGSSWICRNGIAVPKSRSGDVFATGTVPGGTCAIDGVNELVTDLPRTIFYETSVTTCTAPLASVHNFSQWQKAPRQTERISGEIRYRSWYGFLPAYDYPLLVFFGIMCLVYTGLAVAWFAVCAFHWRELMRLQFLISGVVIMGLFTMVIFYSDYASYNKSGVRRSALMVFANFVFALKKTFARLLCIVVAMGFGIVRSTIGDMADKLGVLGVVYLLVSFGYDVCFSVYRQYGNEDYRKYVTFFIVFVLAFDGIITYLVFVNIHRTMKQLISRRNDLKLRIYWRFSYILVGCVISAIVFFFPYYSYAFTHRDDPSFRIDMVWLESAFWHVLFFVVLLSMCVLFRPVANNIRYSYAAVADDDEELEMDHLDDRQPVSSNLSGGGRVKSRSRSRSNSTSAPHDNNDDDDDDDLRWVEENVPSGSLPTDFLDDSDNEVFDAKLESSKRD